MQVGSIDALGFLLERHDGERPVLRLSPLARVSFIFGLLLVTILAACSSNSGGSDANAEPGNDCDDGKSCTIDAVVNGACTHSVGPASGDTACPAGKFCTLGGCVKAPACATRADCEKAWMDDPCRSNPRCDAASSVCVFDQLDKDNDGHAPVICGGDDCDDGNPSRAPGQDEVCDGLDNDCDGQVDKDATCTNPLESCHEGACQCPKANQCGKACVDMQTDVANCGSCHHACGDGFSCDGGECSCASPGTICEDACVDLQTDEDNCGGCGTACAAGVKCSDGACSCPEDQMLCTDGCVDLATDIDNCGSCENACANEGEVCRAGACMCSLKGAAACKGTCIDVSSDESNCGACGKTCEGGAQCVGGVCRCPGGAVSCDGTCIDVAHDVANCGACDAKCGAGETCEEGTCFDPRPRWPMPNPSSTGLPNPQSYDTTTTGVVTDKVTGLMWERSVAADSMYWKDAAAYCADLVLAGKDDWRLPSRVELVSLVDFTLAKPAIDRTAFPGTPSAEFWTISPGYGVAGYAWTVDFTNGEVAPFGNHRDVPTDALRVRCVRVAKTGTTGTYTIANGTAYDPRTRLTWQAGWDDWSWESSFYWSTTSAKCAGTGLAGTGWRVPSVKELQTIVDETTASPSIDAATFPSTPTYAFWTSSPVASQAGAAWSISFEKGWTGTEPAANARSLRCVR